MYKIIFLALIITSVGTAQNNYSSNDSAVALNNKAGDYLMVDSVDKAISLYDASIRMDSSYMMPYFNKLEAVYNKLHNYKDSASFLIMRDFIINKLSHYTDFMYSLGTCNFKIWG